MPAKKQELSGKNLSRRKRGMQGKMGRKSKMDKWRSCDIIDAKYFTVSSESPQTNEGAESITSDT